MLALWFPVIIKFVTGVTYFKISHRCTGAKSCCQTAHKLTRTHAHLHTHTHTHAHTHARTHTHHTHTIHITQHTMHTTYIHTHHAHTHHAHALRHVKYSSTPGVKCGQICYALRTTHKISSDVVELWVIVLRAVCLFLYCLYETVFSHFHYALFYLHAIYYWFKLKVSHYTMIDISA